MGVCGGYDPTPFRQSEPLTGRSHDQQLPGPRSRTPQAGPPAGPGPCLQCPVKRWRLLTLALFPLFLLP